MQVRIVRVDDGEEQTLGETTVDPDRVWMDVLRYSAEQWENRARSSSVSALSKLLAEQANR